jgi:hypothetical protein
MRSNAVGGGQHTLSLAWDGAVMMPLQGQVWKLSLGGGGGNLQADAAQLFLFVPIPAKAKISLVFFFLWSCIMTTHETWNPVLPTSRKLSRRTRRGRVKKGKKLSRKNPMTSLAKIFENLLNF